MSDRPPLEAQIEHLEWCLQELTNPSPDLVETLEESGIRLSKSEVRIVGVLESRNAIFSKEAIHTAMHWDSPDCDWGCPRTVKVHIHHLRHKLEGSGLQIESVWNRGYRLSPHPKEARRE